MNSEKKGKVNAIVWETYPRKKKKKEERSININYFCFYRTISTLKQMDQH